MKITPEIKARMTEAFHQLRLVAHAQDKLRPERDNAWTDCMMRLAGVGNQKRHHRDLKRAVGALETALVQLKMSIKKEEIREEEARKT